MMTKEGKFRDPRGRGFCARVWPYKSYRENALFLKKSLLPGMDQTKLACRNDQGRVYTNHKFYELGAGVLAKWILPYKSYSENT